MDERAKQEWRRLVPILKRMRVLTEADALMLANLCQAVSTMVQAQKILNEKGFLYKAPSGYVMQSPLLSVVNQSIQTITTIAREFGLTPAARTRLVVNPISEEDKWAAARARLQEKIAPRPGEKPRELKYLV